MDTSIIGQIFHHSLKFSFPRDIISDKHRMNRVNCEACLTLGMDTEGNHIDYFFYAQGNPVKIRLCYNHSIELFKFGQSYFTARYPTDVYLRSRGNNKSPERLKNYFVFNPR